MPPSAGLSPPKLQLLSKARSFFVAPPAVPPPTPLHRWGRRFHRIHLPRECPPPTPLRQARDPGAPLDWSANPAVDRRPPAGPQAQSIARLVVAKSPRGASAPRSRRRCRLTAPSWTTVFVVSSVMSFQAYRARPETRPQRLGRPWR